MTGIDGNVIFGAFITILLAVIAFFFRRERELATLQAMLAAAHKRLDRIEGSLNGHKKTMDE